MSAALPDLLDRATDGRRLAVRDDAASLTHAELRAAVDALATRLAANGVRPGDAVLLATENRVADVVGMLAILRLAGVVVPLRDARATSAVLAYADRTSAILMVRAGEIVRLSDAARRTALPELEGAAFVLFTSGSTGEPKGVVLGADEFAGKLAAIAAVIPCTPPVPTLVALSLSFAFGIWVTLLTLRHGGTVELSALTARDVLRTLVQRDAERVALVPTILRAAIVKRKEHDVRGFLDQLAQRARCCILTGGEPLGPALRADLVALLPSVAIYDIFGLTETTTSDFILTPDAPPDARDTVGYPTPGVRFRLVATGGAPVAAGEPGELEILTPFRMRGYLGRADLTAAAFRDGYFRTGDIVRLRPSGALEILGRSKELIVRGGVKISPIEMERAATAHPAVGAALAVGLPDAVLGERAWLAVVPHTGARIEPDALRAFVAEHAERHLVPDEIRILAELPAGPTGKASRNALRTLLAPAIARSDVEELRRIEGPGAAARSAPSR